MGTKVFDATMASLTSFVDMNKGCLKLRKFEILEWIVDNLSKLNIYTSII